MRPGDAYIAGMSGHAFTQWSRGWMQLADFTSSHDACARIDSVLELCDQPVPGRWWRGPDERLRDPYRRYQRGDGMPGRQRTGEHALEYDVLIPEPAQVATDCMGARLVDGVNALPLARDEGGGRAGNVEADMLLLAGESKARRIYLVEAKVSGNAWHAVVENLRQFRLFRESPFSQKLFHVRHPGLSLDHPLPVTAIVLAPPAFYEAGGKARTALDPARELLRRVNDLWSTDAGLATWDTAARSITEA